MPLCNIHLIVLSFRMLFYKLVFMIKKKKHYFEKIALWYSGTNGSGCLLGLMSKIINVFQQIMNTINANFER